MARSATLRSKRLDKPLNARAARFLDSTREDRALVRDDVLGTLAHVTVLQRGGVLSPREARDLRRALDDLVRRPGRLALDPDFEDVHMNVEQWLTRRVGDLGKKVHTGRSRNDQVALDLRLWTRRAILDLAEATDTLASSLLRVADRHGSAILPGHTHFQPAQPVLLGHVCGAHVARLLRDLDRLRAAYDRLDVSPLGAAALAGTRQHVNPALAAMLLGFKVPFSNSLDAVSDRDFVHDLLHANAVLLNHVSGLAEEIILLSHPAFGFFAMDDAHATGSSLMPQKKNPDILEVARARAATAIGALTASLAQTKALPLAYNRDLQEQKRLFLEAVPSGAETVRAVASLVSTLTVHEDRMRAQAAVGHMDATELADYLVAKDVPFREAHAVAARCVQVAIAKGLTLSDVGLEEFQGVDARIGRDVFDFLGPDATVAAKTSPGGTARPAARSALTSLRRQLAQTMRFFRTAAKHVARAEARLATAPFLKTPR